MGHGLPIEETGSRIGGYGDASTCALKVPNEPGPWTYRLIMMCLCALFVATLAGFASRPAEQGTYAVLVLPHEGEAALVSAIGQAGGALVRQSRLPWLAIAMPQDESSPETFRSALRQAGIRLVLHPAMVAGCFTPTQIQTAIGDTTVRNPLL